MKFYKYNSTGNDFILIQGVPSASFNRQRIIELCHRNLGIGADGLFFVSHLEGGNDLNIVMYNSDGSEASMCANGCRATIHFAKHVLNINEKVNLHTKSGIYKGYVKNNASHLEFLQYPKILKTGIQIENYEVAYINSGCEQAVIEVESLDNLKIEESGPLVRHSKEFPHGVNVNFYKLDGETVRIRTYEKGCERETLSCGTGVMATAMFLFEKSGKREFSFQTKGGELFVRFEKDLALYFGEVSLVYTGIIT